jgi:hypothetical protein
VRGQASVTATIIERVPRISSFYGIVIEMYFGDHPPPHFHARYSGVRPRSRLQPAP